MKLTRSNRRALVVEQLEFRQMLSAMDPFVSLDDAASSFTDIASSIDDCAKLPCSVGYFASQARTEVSSELTDDTQTADTPDDSDAVNTDDASDFESIDFVDDYFEEDAPEGENPFDASAPPVPSSPPAIEPVVNTPEPAASNPAPPPPAVLPLGVYLENLYNGSSNDAHQLPVRDANSQFEQQNGGYIQLQFAEQLNSTVSRSKYESNAMTQSLADDSDESLTTLQHYSVNDSDEALTDDEDLVESTEGDSPDTTLLSPDAEAEFIEQFGGLIVDTVDEPESQEVEQQIPQRDESAPAEPTREQYQIVDVIIGTSQAFEVIDDDADFIIGADPESDDSVSEPVMLPLDRTTTEAPPARQTDSSTSASTVVSSASIAFFLGTRRRPRRRRFETDAFYFVADE
ncbi:MAG: hypothetical protein KDB27_02380 [Planctomycetales bacterium]|nr:hypothetical protein [Planctomycetales bacterium]